MPSPPPGMKLCFRCGALKPVEDFVRKSANQSGRTRDCRECHRRYEKIRKGMLSRDHKRARDFSEALTKLREAETDTRVRLLLNRLSERMGGFGRLLDYWGDVIESDLKRGGYPAWRHIGAVLRLMEHLERVKPDVSQMSDEELEDRLAELDAQVSRV